MRYILLATTIAMLCSCGWQLRDAQVVPSTIGSLHVATQLPNREIVNQLTRALNVYGVEVVDAASQADYSVMIIDFRETRRIATLNASARVAEYQLNDDVDFMIAGADSVGTAHFTAYTASVERSYEIEETRYSLLGQRGAAGQNERCAKRLCDRFSTDSKCCLPIPAQHQLLK